MTAPATTLQNAPPPAALESEVPHRSGRRGLDRKRLFLWSLPILFFIAAAIIGPYIWPYDSLEVRTGDRLQPPLAILKDGSRAARLARIRLDATSSPRFWKVLAYR
ncbi:MAG: hypothetical protein R2845_13715 [Thermomicrobiales bacterium]